jgi:hypothetical protein
LKYLGRKPISLATVPGHKTDTRLHLFEEEFHVHFVILEIGSIYFRKFLDSAFYRERRFSQISFSRPINYSSITTLLLSPLACLGAVGNPVVANLSGVDMTFAVFLSASCLCFVITFYDLFHDGGNDCWSVDLYVNQRLDW